MPHQVVSLDRQQVIDNALNAELAHRIHIRHYGALLLGLIRAQQIGWERAIVHNDAIYPPAQIVVQLADEVGRPEAIRLAMFGHEVADVDLLG